jgi:hypothetical protein
MATILEQLEMPEWLDSSQFSNEAMSARVQERKGVGHWPEEAEGLSVKSISSYNAPSGPGLLAATCLAAQKLVCCIQARSWAKALSQWLQAKAEMLAMGAKPLSQ